MSNNTRAVKKQLFNRLSEVSAVDERAFRNRLRRASTDTALAAIATDIDAAAAKLVARKDAFPEISYPEELPVSGKRTDIADAIADHQVVIIAGETGSGKTTQIPKICLDVGRGLRGRIGHTQPRRLAARSVAERIANELGEQIGQTVGYAIRFDDKVSDSTAIKLMTDGILLAEIQRDRYLNQYDTIIIDEAHERSLNIDFLLGYFRELLPKRPDLKLIITSATIDPERFANHFADADGTPAPIIEVSGRTYPVEVRYRPLEVLDDEGKLVDELDQTDGVIAACEELMREGDGDILAFFAGEADIRETKEAMEGRAGRMWSNIDIVPLYGRLSNQDQHKVFHPTGRRRIVLATNIAETSLTVPGIHYVVDTGLARISRYSVRTKVQRLPIEPISQASANQRSGRSGRIADGIAIRLYSEQDFRTRDEFTDPEILRTNLASVILQMAALRLGDITQFPFVQAPDFKAIKDGLGLLTELGAIAEPQSGSHKQPSRKQPAADRRVQGAAANSPRLTDVGRDLARLPVDPRMARILVEAHRNGSLHQVLTIVAALSIQDVRERPTEFQAQADQLHARFKDKDSDFAAYLNLWDYLQTKRRELSGNQFRKLCKREYLHYIRVREWMDLVRQLSQVIRQLGWSYSTAAADPTLINQALLSGLLSHIGMRAPEGKMFRGARNTEFLVHPASALSKKPPQYVMAAELVETSRLFARDCARIEPKWVEELAADQLKYQYSEPHWSTKRAAAMATEKATLFGVPIIDDREVAYDKVDPVAARDMFIRHALVGGEWQTHHKFFAHNRQLLAEAAELEDKARRRDIVVDDDALFAFYDAKLPASCTTGIRFDRWWKRTRQKSPELLNFDPQKLVNPDSAGVDGQDFPDVWQQADHSLPLSYNFEPGAHNDGVTVTIPLASLASMEARGFDWQVPGLREELATALIRSLPKAQRKHIVPAPDFAAAALARMTPYQGDFADALAEALRSLGAGGLTASMFDPTQLPPHLRINFAVTGKRGKVIDEDRDFVALRSRQKAALTSAVSSTANEESPAVAVWTADNLGDIPESVHTSVAGHPVTVYPALQATRDGVKVQRFPTKADADVSMFAATLTMLLREIVVKPQSMIKGLPLQQRVAAESWPHGGVTALVEDCRVAVVKDLLIAAGGPMRSPTEFAKFLQETKPKVPGQVRQLVVALAPAAVRYQRVAGQLAQWTGPAIEDMSAQLAFLLPPQAVTKYGWSRLRHLDRYLHGMEVRLEDMGRDPDRDGDLEDQAVAVEQALDKKLAQLPKGFAGSEKALAVRWMMQEFRVSLFAQRLGTAGSISAARISKAINKLPQ